MKGKRLKSSILAVAMLMTMSFSACGGDKGVSNSTQATNAGTGTGIAAAGTQETVTLKIMGNFDVNQVSNGIATDPVAKYIEEKLGIKMDITASGTVGDVSAKVSAMIAANDLPDIFYLPDQTKQLVSAAQGGLLLAVDDYLPEYGKNFTSESLNKFMVEYFKTQCSPDGKLYGIATNKGTMGLGLYPDVSNYIRWDVYKKVGTPEIKTWEDTLTVLKQMQDAEGTTADGKKVYGVGGWFGESGGDFLFSYMPGYINGELVLGSCYSYSAIKDDISGSDVYTDKNSVWWQSIKWFNKANQMGILDPDSFTQKSDQYGEKVNAGRYLWTAPSWYAAAANSAFNKAGTPEKGFIALPPMGDAFIRSANTPTGCEMVAIAKSCKYPERAVQLLDFFNSYDGCFVIFNGPEDINWTMKDGKPTPTEEYLNPVKADNFYKTTGATLYSFLSGLSGAETHPQYNVPLNLMFTSEALSASMNDVQKDAASHYGVSSLDEVYKKAKITSFSWLLPSALNDSQAKMPDELKINETNLQDYLAKNKFKLLLAKTDAEFEALQDKFISEVKAYNVENVFKYYREQADTLKTDFSQMLKETGN